MHVEFHRLHEAYEEIKRTAFDSSGQYKVLILVAPGVDSLCGLKILSSLLRVESITYEILPISSYSELEAANRMHINNNNNLRTVILLNFGSLIDVSCFLTPINQVKIHIIDPHRPYNAKALFSSENIIFWDDKTVEKLESVKKAFRALCKMGAYTEDSLENGQTRKRCFAETEDLIENPSDDMDYDKPHLEKIIHRYHNKPFPEGMSVSGILYALCSQIGRVNEKFLWMAIISLSDQYLDDRIPPQLYNSQAKVYKEEISRVFSGQNAVDLEKQIDELVDCTHDLLDTRGDERPANAGDTTINFGTELRLMFLRHWSLYESMYHSSFVGSRLGIWKEQGKRKLVNLLTKMGLPHRESLQLYSEMSISYKRAVRKRLINIASKYNMSGIVFPSFWKHYGYKGTLSASDMVYSLTALLELDISDSKDLEMALDLLYISEDHLNPICPNTNLLNDAEFRNSKLTGVGAGTLVGPTSQNFSPEDSYAPCSNNWIGKFYTAYDALENFDLLHKGISLAISLQRLLVSTGISILEKNLMQILRGFQLAILQGGSSENLALDLALKSSRELKYVPGEYSVFAKSEVYLCKLAKFLYETYGRYRKKLPVVVAALNQDTDKYLIASFYGYELGRRMRNPICVAFRKAAERIDVDIKRDSFYTSIVEVSREDLSEFLESLQFCIS